MMTDREASRAYLDRFLGHVASAGALAVVAVADRLGVLSALAQGPATPVTLANRSGVDRRYLEETMAALAAAGLVEYQAEDGTFWLPAGAQQCLVDSTSPYYVVGWAQILTALSARVGEVARAFVAGEGIPPSVYGDELREAMIRTNSPATRALLVSKWLPALPDVVAGLQRGIRVADIGCGAGTAALAIAEAFPASTVIGYDTDVTSIETARAAATHLPNLSFQAVPAEELSSSLPFDFILAIDAIHDMSAPQVALVAIHQALAPNGCFLMVEPNLGTQLADNLHPTGALLYSLSALYCVPVSRGGGSGNGGLGAGWGSEAAERMAREAGFGRFERLPIQTRTNSFYRLGN